MAVLVAVRVKAKVWALARRDAHSFGLGRIRLCLYRIIYRFRIGLYRIISDCIGFKRVWSVLYRIYIGLYRVWSGLVGSSKPHSCRAHHAHGEKFGTNQ